MKKPIRSNFTQLTQGPDKAGFTETSLATVRRKDGDFARLGKIFNGELQENNTQ
jgi:hypothetical protein